jgi:hypothetical protein
MKSQMAMKLSALRAVRTFTPIKIPGDYFCLRLSRPQGHSAVGRIRSIEKSNNLIRNRNRDFPARSIVPQPTMLPHVPSRIRFVIEYLFVVLVGEDINVCLYASFHNM